MKLLPNTLAFRLTFWYTLVVIILITIAFNASYFLLSKALDHDMEQDLIEDIGEFRTLYQKAGLAGVKQEINRDLMKSGEEERIFFSIALAIRLTSFIPLTERPATTQLTIDANGMAINNMAIKTCDNNSISSWVSSVDSPKYNTSPGAIKP